jgi:MFS family permease
MAIPTLVFWATNQLDVRHRGRGMGFWSSAFFLGQFVSPVVVGLVRGASGGGILSAFLTLGVVSAAAAAVSLLLGLKKGPARVAAAPVRAG